MRYEFGDQEWGVIIGPMLPNKLRGVAMSMTAPYSMAYSASCDQVRLGLRPGEAHDNRSARFSGNCNPERCCSRS